MFSLITSFAITMPPETFISGVLVSVKGIFGDFAPLFWLIIGVYIAFEILFPLTRLFLYWGSRQVFGGRYRLYKTTDEDEGEGEVDDDFDDDDEEEF